MPSNSETIISIQAHVGDSTIQTHTGTKYKGDGYYGRSDGIHTVQYDLNSFIGTIKMQGTLATTPTDSDYFDIISTTETSTTGASIYNFTGNYVWVRTVVTYTNGAVTSIKLNH